MTTLWVANVTGGTFAIGDTVTGLSSGAVGVVDTYASGVMELTLSGQAQFQIGETVASAKGGVIATVAVPPLISPDDEEGTDGESVPELPADPVDEDTGTSDADAESTPTDIIAAIDQAIANGGDVASYTVNGRTVVLRSLSELLAARRYYLAEKAKAQGLRRTRVRFLE